jgi:hypothetical protein
MARFFEKASGAKQAPLLVDEGEHRRERHRDHQQREEDARADLEQRLEAHAWKSPWFPSRHPVVDLVVGVLDLDDGAVDSTPIEMAMPASDMRLAFDAEGVQGDERQRDGDRDGDDGDDRRWQVPEEEQDDQRDDEDLLDQLLADGGDGAADELGAVVVVTTSTPSGSDGAARRAWP